MENAYAMLLAISVSFFVGVLFLFLLVVIAAVSLWKCGIRLEKRGSSSREAENAPPDAAGIESAEHRAPHWDEEGVGPTRQAVCSHCPRSVATSSRRPSSQMLVSLRRSRKASSDPLSYSRLLHRRARCVSLGTDLRGKRKPSDPCIDFVGPCAEWARRGSIWTRDSSDSSIIFENEHWTIIAHNRQKTATLGHPCGQKSRTLPLPLDKLSSEPIAASATPFPPAGCKTDAQRPPCRPTSLADKPPVDRTLKTVQEITPAHDVESRDCGVAYATGSDRPPGSLDDSGFTAKREASNDPRHLSWDKESDQGDTASSDQSMDQPPAMHGTSGYHPFIGHAVTGHFVFDASPYKGRFSGKQLK